MARITYAPDGTPVHGLKAQFQNYWAKPWLRYLALTICVLLALASLLPLYWMTTGSFKIQRSSFSYPPEIFPSEPTLENWQKLLAESPAVRWMVNSFFVAGGIALASVITSTMAGYAFGKKVFPGRSILFWGFLLTMMLPRQIYLIPLFIIMRDFDWFNTFQGMIAPYIAYPFGIFLMRQFMEAIPDELLEAAIIDGANEWQLFYRIIIPLARPAIGAIAIFSFMMGWNDYLWQLVIVTEEQMMTLPVGISKLTASGLGNIDIGVSMAGATFAFIPMLIVFLMFQKHFIKGLTVGALKG